MRYELSDYEWTVESAAQNGHSTKLAMPVGLMEGITAGHFERTCLAICPAANSVHCWPEFRRPRFFVPPHAGGTLARPDPCFPVHSATMNLARESSGNSFRRSR